MKRSIEKLSHFECASCQKWWSVGDAPEDKKTWYCAWCGHSNTEEESPPKPEEQSFNYFGTEEALKWLQTLDDALKLQIVKFGKFNKDFSKAFWKDKK